MFLTPLPQPSSLQAFQMLTNAKQLLCVQNGSADPDKPACNSQELEDCDGFPEDSFSLTHFDEETLRPTQVVSNTHLTFR